MKIRLFFILGFLLLPVTGKAEYLCRPSLTDTLNPYEMIDQEMRPVTGHCHPWEVYANKDGAPITDVNKNLYIGLSTRFLEPFVALRKYEDLIEVCPQDDFDYDKKECRAKKRGWISMKDLLLLRMALRNKQKIYQKAFIKVKVDEMIGQDSVKNDAKILCFRSGPGPIGAEIGSYRSLSSKDDIPKIGNLFYYIFSVAFENDKKKLFTGSSLISLADYFLLGNSITSNEDNLKNNILGWLPKESVVPWETRQALEMVEKRSIPVHKFATEQDLNMYFRTPISQREIYLDELIKNKRAEKDTGVDPVFTGQMLRPLILKLVKHNPGELPLESALIGYTGDLLIKGGGEKIQKIDKNILTDLALISEGTKHVDVFFLIDGTTSMEPVISLAAKTITKIRKELNQYNDLKIFIRAAIYRDDKAGIREYQIWHGKGDPAQWLSSVDIRMNPADDYRESLFEGIFRSVKDWKFSHPRSVRLLVILGDAGDNGRSSNLTNSNEVARLLMKQQIYPLPIHFNHPLTRENLDPGKFGAICDEKRLDKLPSTYVNASERSAMCGFVNDMDRVISIMNTGIVNPKARIRKTNSMHVHDLETFLNACVGHLRDSLNISVTKIHDARSGTIGARQTEKQQDYDPNDAISPMFEYRMEKLKRKYPDLAVLLENRAEMAFLKAYVPISYEDKTMMRPVWLLSNLELDSIDNGVGAIRRIGKAGCDIEDLGPQLRTAVLSALGDMLSMSPKEVSDEMLDSWVGLDIVSDQNSYVDLAKEMMEEICWNKNKCENFINQLEKVDENINKIKKDSSGERKYYDKSGSIFYWVYPHELYPFSD